MTSISDMDKIKQFKLSPTVKNTSAIFQLIDLKGLDKNIESIINGLKSSEINALMKYLDLRANRLEQIRMRMNMRGLFERVKGLEPLIAREKKLHGLLRSKLGTVQNTAAHPPMLINTQSNILINESHALGASMAGNSIKYIIAVKGLMELIRFAMERKLTRDHVQNFAITIAKSGGNAYVKGVGISMLSSALKVSSNSILRRLGHSNLPALLIFNAELIIRDFNDFYTGKIESEEFFTRLSRTGSDMSISGTCIAAGQVAIPIPVVGGVIGGIVGYTLNQAYFSSLIKMLKERAIAEKELKRVQEECDKRITQLQKERLAFEQIFTLYYGKCCECFSQSMQMINDGLLNNNPDLVIQGANNITTTCGGNPIYKSYEEFEEIIKDSNSVVEI